MRTLDFGHAHQRVAQGGPYDVSVNYQKTKAHNSQRCIFLSQKITFKTLHPITNSMEHSPSRETNRPSANQEIPRIL
jgi:hypothetical protein